MVLIVVEYGTWILDNAFFQILFSVGVTQIERLKFLDHFKDVAKAYILSRNIDEQGTNKQINYQQNTSR